MIFTAKNTLPHAKCCFHQWLRLLVPVALGWWERGINLGYRLNFPEMDFSDGPLLVQCGAAGRAEHNVYLVGPY